MEHEEHSAGVSGAGHGPSQTALAADREDRPGYSPYRLGAGVSIVLALAAIMLFVSFFALWANRQILNTDQWTKTSTELIERPAVQNALANYMVDELFDQVDVEQEIKQQLPEDWGILASPATSALRSLTLTGTKRVLELPVTQEAWSAAAEISHHNLIALLSGGNSAVSTTGGTVTLNARTILQQAADKVGVSGNLVDKIPAEAGSFEIYHSDDLRAAQSAYKTFKNLSWLFALLTVALYVAAIALAAGRRRRAVIWMGSSFLTVGLLVLITISFAREPAVDSLAQTTAVQPAVRDVYDIATELLRRMSSSLIFTGALVLLAGIFAGPEAWAVRSREFLAPWLRDQLPLAAAAAVLLYLILLWIAPVDGMRTSVGIVINTTLAIIGFIALVGITRREFPDAEAPDFAAAGAWIGQRWKTTRDFVSDRARAVDLPNLRGGPDTSEAVTVEVHPASADDGHEAAEAAPAETASSGVESDAPEPAGGGDAVAQLERLVQLHKSGALTDDEFAAAKRRLLG